MGRAGFTLLELAIALTIFAIGALALVSSTVYIVRQVTIGSWSSERTVAITTTIEQLRATPYDSLSSGSQTYGQFDVDWTVLAGARTKEVSILVSGPGVTNVPGAGSVLGPGVVDTFEYRVIRP